MNAFPALRPLDLGDLLDESIGLYRRNFALFAGIVAVLAVPEAIISILVIASEPTVTTVLPNGATQTTHSSVAGSLYLAAISLIFSILIWGALSLAISYRYLGRDTTVVDAYSRVGIGRFVSLGLAAILAAVCIFVAFFTIVGWIFLAVRWLFVPQAVVLENASVGQAFGRSWNLTRGSFWRLLGYGIVLIIIITLIQVALGAVIGALLSLGSSTGAQALGQALNAIIGILVRPFEFTALTLLYYDMRVRKEGFDVQVMAETLDRRPGA